MSYEEFCQMVRDHVSAIPEIVDVKFRLYGTIVDVTHVFFSGKEISYPTNLRPCGGSL